MIKCAYCGRYGEAGRCAGCGAPLAPVAPAGILEAPGPLTPEALERLRRAWLEQAEAGRVLVLESGGQWLRWLR